MKVVILAGGYGSRLSEYTKKLPKPMVKINNVPIILYIMKHYKRYGFSNFCLALGYKGSIIKKFFKKKKFKWCSVNLINTGKDVMTGGRLKRLQKFLEDEQDFFLTYGDGVSNINLEKLLKFHKKNKKIATISAVRPPARFGFIKLNGKKIKYFKEKSNLDEGWINGGFMVLNKKIFSYLKNDNTYLERDPMEKLSKAGQLYAFKHKGFWQCMDTLRDKEILEKSIKQKKHLAR